MSLPAPRTGRRPAAWVVWLRRFVFAWASGLALVAGWRFARVPGTEPPWRSGGHPEVGVELQDLTGPVLLVVAALVLTVLLTDLAPRTMATLALLAAAAYLALGGLAFAVVPALALVLLRLGRGIDPRAAWPWVVALVPVYLVARWPRPWLGLDSPDAWGALASMLMWTLLPSLFGLLTHTRREAAERAHAEALRQAAADERLRVARDIHDVVGHSLSMISLQSGVALRVLESDPAQVRASLEAIRGSSKDALAELRHTLGVFRDDEAPLAPTPGLDGVTALVEAARTGGVRVGLEVPGADVPVPRATQAVAYRVVQEGLTNAIRHAPGAEVRVGVRVVGGSLVVTVVDAGGAAGPFVEGTGLRGMRERVERLGGRLRVDADGAATTVEAVLPLGTEDA